MTLMKKMFPFNSACNTQPHAAFSDVSNTCHPPLWPLTAATTHNNSLIHRPGNSQPSQPPQTVTSTSTYTNNLFNPPCTISAA
jgi:hypothetical protein